MSKNVCYNCGTSHDPDDRFCQKCGTKLENKHPDEPVESVKPAEIQKKPEMLTNKEYFVHHSSVPAVNSVSKVDPNLKSYVSIIGAIEIIFGILALIGSVFLGMVTAFVPNYLLETEVRHGMAPIHIVPFVSVILGLVTLMVLVFAILSLISGYRLMQYKKSGRIGSMIVGALALFNFPFGTIFGVFTFYVLSKPEIELVLA